LLLLVRAAGVFGGISLVRDSFGMPLSWLHQTPFTTWTLPGIALLIGVTVPQLTALGLLVSGYRWALAGGYLAGIGLVLWIAVQMLVLQRYFFMQPVIAAAGPRGDTAGPAVPTGSSNAGRLASQADPPPRALTLATRYSA
jgi:tellurite resistance protein TehA-like permease